jgi:hypothetical protein
LGFSSNNIPNNLPCDKLESITQINLPNYSPKGTSERDRRSGRLVESVKSSGIYIRTHRFKDKLAYLLYRDENKTFLLQLLSNYGIRSRQLA